MLRRLRAKKNTRRRIIKAWDGIRICFFLKIELSSLRSEKVICALRDFLVLGYTRKESCEKHDVSYGYFSKSLKRVNKINCVVANLVNHYFDD